MQKIEASELIINEDGSIYHLLLKPGDLAKTIITVGDQNRAKLVAKKFDKILLEKQNREFLTFTGLVGEKKISVISTGIGTDNIDIVFNEIDALFNVNFEERKIKEKLETLNFIRLGTSGAIQKDIEVGNILLSKFVIGVDALMTFYNYEANADEKNLFDAFNLFVKANEINIPFYVSSVSKELFEIFLQEKRSGITITNPGFYAPQSRSIRLSPKYKNYFEVISKYEFEKLQITNLEMETSGIYALANMLGHHAISINAILANRATKKFAENSSEIVNQMIENCINTIKKNNFF